MTPVRILLVEDEFIVARDLQAHLEKLGYTVCGRVNSGEKAFEHVSATPTDLVLMDIMLKGQMNGIEAAAAIRSKFHLPVIYVTANTNPQILEQAKITEPFGFIVKPFNERELQANIEMSLYKHRMERQLRASEEKYRKLIENANEIIAVIQHGVIKFVNPRIVDLSGYTSAELIDQSFAELIHPGDRALALERHQRRLEGEETLKTYALRMFDKWKRMRWVELRAVVIEWEGELATLNFLNDITERKLAEDALQEQKALLDEIFKGVQEGLALVDEFQTILFANPAYAAIVGVSEYELVGNNAFLFFGDEARSFLIQEMKKRGKGQGSTYELPLTTMRGVAKDVRLTVAPRFGAGDQVIGEFVTLLDITDRKQAEEELRRHKEHLELIVAQRTRELVQINQELSEEVIERRRIEAELRMQSNLLEEANRAKTEFLANMSHELRTPLNGVLGYAQLLKRAPELSETYREYVESILRSGQHLLTILNDILDISKLETGRLQIEPIPFDLPRFLTALVEMARLNARQKGIRMHYEPVPNLPLSVLGDEKRLRQILFHLLGNAVKFTHQGSVTFRIVDLGSEILDLEEPQGNRAFQKSKIKNLKFEIIDTGIGIAPEQLEHIFDPFVQLNTRQRFTEGTGLGLTISRRLARMMGSDLHVESTVNAGSRFWFEVTLPEIGGTVTSLGATDLTTVSDPLQSVEQEPMIPPADEDLRILEELILIGDVMGVQVQIERLRTADPRLKAFTDHLEDIANALRISEMQRFVRGFLKT